MNKIVFFSGPSISALASFSAPSTVIYTIWLKKKYILASLGRLDGASNIFSHMPTSFLVLSNDALFSLGTEQEKISAYNRQYY